MLKWVISFIAAVCLSFVPITVQAEGNSGNGFVSDYLDKQDSKKSDSPEKKQQPKEVENTSDGGSTFFMIVKLVFMLGVVLAILFFVLRFIQKKSVRFQEGKNLQSLGGIGIGPNRSVQLVKTGSSVLVVGVGDTVTLLKEITDEDEIKKMLEQPQMQNVGSLANQWMSKLQKKEHSQQSTKSPNTNFKDMFSDLISDRKEKMQDVKKAFEEGKHHD